MARTFQLIDAQTGHLIADRIEIADTFWKRFRGLMLRAPLPDGSGLLIQPCSSIHMLFMRFPIDAVFLDRDHRVLAIARRVRPWVGIAARKGAHAVIELPAGAASSLQPGDVLRLQPQD